MINAAHGLAGNCMANSFTAMSGQSLATLPTELLMVINSLLDVPTLFSLARTSRFFNEIAICELEKAGRHGGISYSPELQWLRLDLSRLSIASLSIIVVPRSISTLLLTFESSMHQYRDQLLTLQWAISRQNAFKKLCIEADLNPTTTFLVKHFEVWWNTLVNLIEIALARGCKTLELSLKIDRIALAARNDDMRRSKLQLSVINRRNSLEECKLSGNLLFEAPVFPWITDLLSCSPIQSLDFDSAFEASDPWYQDFRILRLSHLKCLWLDTELPWTYLQEFLGNHHQLRNISIIPKHIRNRDQIQGTIPLLADLEYLRIHSLYAPGFLSVNRPLSKLHWCTIDLISDGSDDIEGVVAACARFSAELVVNPISQLRLQFSTESTIDALQTWLQKFPNDTSLSRPSFPRIERLMFYLAYSAPHPSPSSLAILREFCALFTDLKIVALEGWLDYDWNVGLIDPFWADLAAVCPAFSTGLIGRYSPQQRFPKIK